MIQTSAFIVVRLHGETHSSAGLVRSPMNHRGIQIINQHEFV